MEVIELVDPIAQLLGIEGASVLATMAVISLVARLIGKAIPDDRTGWVGILRTVCKIIGLYTPNRVTSQVSVEDTANNIK
jgi:apolipoprotein N-acyltransferase